MLNIQTWIEGTAPLFLVSFKGASNMLQVELWVEGLMPLLQHRATEEALAGDTRPNTIGERPDPRDQAEAVVYRNPKNRQLYCPGTYFARMIREAGGSHKAKGSRKSLKYLVPAALIITDEICPLFLPDRKTPITDYEVDSRPVTIPSTKGRIMRHRPRINDWTCLVHMRLNEQLIAEATIRQLFVEGLQQIGIGDFRPTFGTSTVVSWNVSEQKLTNSQRRNAGLRVAAE